MRDARRQDAAAAVHRRQFRHGRAADAARGRRFVLLEHHLLDSTGFLELCTFLEETYAIMVDDDEMVPENLDSLDSLVTVVSRERASPERRARR